MEIFYSILSLATGVGVFLIGMSLMSEGLEKSSSQGMRSLFKKIDNRRLASVGIGAGVTALVQSSSATTVMVIGLVNAGILSLFQATAIIMGANIGTTVTGLLVAFSSFSIKYVFMTLTFVGAIIKIITKKDSLKKIADAFIGFGILFVGLELMSGAFSTNVALQEFFKNIFAKIEFPLLLILIGTVFTAVVQSSSASTGIFITMIGTGLLTFNSALYLILGANIGTCVTAALASIGANTNAKRAALIHVMFNVLGTVLFTAILWPTAKFILPVYEKLVVDPQWQLSIFHVIFNVVTTVALLFFIKPLTNLACIIVKEKIDDDEILRTYYIDDRLLSTPSIAIEQTMKETSALAIRTHENLSRAFNTLISYDLSEKEKITREENKINYINNALSRFIVQVAASNVSLKDEKLMGGLHHVINDIERIGDHAVNFAEDATAMSAQSYKFEEAEVEELKEMFQKVNEMYLLSINTFKSRSPSYLSKMSELEQQVDSMKIQLTERQIQRLNKGECPIEGSKYYYTAIISLERIADHLINIAFSIRSYTGNQTETFRKLAAENNIAREKQAKRKI